MANTETSTATTQPPVSVPVHRSKRRFLIIIGLIILILAIAGAILLYSKEHVGQKVYAQAAGHKVYKKEIDSMEYVGGKKTGVTDRQAATVLADKYLYQAMAKQQGVTVSQADITAAYGPSFNLRKSTNPYAYQNQLNQLYLTALYNHNQGIYSGKLLVANFSKNVPYQSALLPEQKAYNPNIGNAAAIAQDKQYAQTFITNLYNQIKAKKITFDQAIQTEHADPVVGEKAYPTQDHSGPFNGPLNRIGLLAARTIRGKLTSMKPGQLSAPFVVKVSNSATDPNSTAESYFLVVQMDKSSGGSSNLTFQQELAQAKKQFGYKVNV